MRPIAETQLRELVDARGAALVLYARQFCLAPDDALQEALVDLARLAEAPHDPVAWLFKAVKLKAINLARSERRREHYQREAAEQRDVWFERDPTDSLQSSELETMLQLLDPIDREIVVAKIWGNMSFEQIAELVDSTRSSVHRRYQQTLEHLERKLNGNPHASPKPQGASPGQNPLTQSTKP